MRYNEQIGGLDMFTLIFALVPILMLLAGLWWIVASQKQAKQIAIAFPPRSTWFGVVLLIGFHLGIYDALTAQIFPSVGLMVFGLVITIAWVILFWQKWTPIICSVLVVMILSALLMPFRASGFIQGITFLVFFISNSLLFLRLIRRAGAQSLLRLCNDAFQAGLQSISQFIALVWWLKNEKTSDSQQKIVGWIKTVSLALIGAIVFIVLLSQADPIFAQLVRDLREQLLGRFIWTVVIALILAVGLSIRQSQEDSPYQLKWFSRRDAIVVVATVCMVIAGFLFVQWQYLFGSSHELLDVLNMSYSEYVRKGFVELLVATLIGGVLSYLLAIKLRNGETSGKRFWLLTAGNTVLVTELFALLISAYKRDLLYVETYGLTRVRIIGEVFLVWLACLLVLLLIFAIWHKLKERSVLLLFGVVTVVAWLGLQVINVDAIIARGAPGHHDYTDYFYIMQLSEDAAREQLALLPDVITETHQLIAKPTLTDEEQSQLAGLKLALLSFRDHRDRLYLHYATEATLLEMSEKLIERWSYDVFVCKGLEQRSLYIDRDPSSCLPHERQLSKRLKTERTWRFYSPTRKQAFDAWSAQPELVWGVDQEIEAIRQYQKNQKLSLFNQEKRLLRDFSYPFLSVRLNYYPGSDDHIDDLAPVDQYNRPDSKSTPTPMVFDVPDANPSPLVKNIVLPTQEPKVLHLNLVTPVPTVDVSVRNWPQ